jgi:hypothetical protein
MQQTHPQHRRNIRDFFHRLTPVASLYALFLASPAHAYVGEKLLQWAKGNLILPLAFCFTIIAACVAMVKPAMLATAFYILLIGAGIVFIISAAPQIMAAMQ